MNSNRPHPSVRLIQDFQLELDRMLQDKTFMEISKKEKTISQKFSLLLKHLQKNFKTFTPVLNSFDKLARALQTIIKSVSGSQFQYVFQYFIQNLRDYEIFSKEKLVLKDTEAVITRQTENLKCPYFQNLVQKEISYKECEELKRKNTFSILNNIQQNKYILPNPSCIGCSTFLIKDKEIINENPHFNEIVALSKKEASSPNILSKYVCALANSGGGIIVVGAEKTKYGIKAIGINFNEIVEVKAQIEAMSSVITKINRNIRFAIQKSLVVNDPFSEITLPNFCYKIFIFPLIKNNKTYTLFIDTNETSQVPENEIYHLNNGKAEQVTPKEEDENTYYKLIHFNYSQVKNRESKSCHRGILCSNSCSQFLEDYVKARKNSVAVHYEMTPVGEVNEDENLEERECVINYSRQCLLLVGIKRQTKLIKELNRHLNEKKCLYQISKPFENQFVEKGRAVYLICHSHKNEFIKEVIKESDKTGGITMIPVFTTLQVEKSEKVMASREELFNKIFQKFSEQPFEREGSTNKDVLLYTLNDKKQAIFTYMIFEHIFNIRPFFVKENTVYSSRKEHYEFQ